MTTNLTKKFKDRSPLETVEIIKNFFEKRGYNIQLADETQSEANTYSCLLILYKNNQKIIHASGKGMTYEFSLASGYAELYERFCNKCNFIRHPFFMQERNNLMKKNYGYSMHPEEKILTYNDIMQYKMYDFFYTSLLHNKNNIEAFWKLIVSDENIIGEPFYDLTNNKIVYHNQQIANRVCTSIGMSAGNTIEEALNQALSELSEHIVTDSFFEKPQNMYYIIDKSSLNKELQDKINNIEQTGLKTYIFDLSYNFNLPTVMILLCNPITKITQVNFGSFPIFDIAVERTITEVYQGIDSFSTGSNINNNFQIPYLSIPQAQINVRKNSLMDTTFFDEEIILHKTQTVSSYNKNIFLENKEIENIELNQYFINLFKTHNFSIHYIDNSLSEDIKAVFVLIPEYCFDYNQTKEYQNMPNSIIYQNLLYIMTYHKEINDILFNSKATLFELLNRFNKIQMFERNDDIHHGELTGILIFLDWFNPIPQMENMVSLVLDLNNLLESHNYLINTVFFKPIKTYVTIQNYVRTNLYSNEKIKNILLQLFDTIITDEDIENCFNQEYLFEKIVIETMRNYYNSQDYKEILQSTIKEWDYNNE